MTCWLELNEGPFVVDFGCITSSLASQLEVYYQHYSRTGDTFVADEKKDKPQEEAPAPGPGTGKAPQAPGQQATRVQVDDSDAPCAYANFCRVTGTPEELIIDFGLNAQPFGIPTEPVKISQRIVTNYYTAKRMLHALHLSVQRHEQAFGVLETDVQKRVISKPTQQQQG